MAGKNLTATVTETMKHLTILPLITKMTTKNHLMVMAAATVTATAMVTATATIMVMATVTASVTVIQMVTSCLGITLRGYRHHSPDHNQPWEASRFRPRTRNLLSTSPMARRIRTPVQRGS